VPRAGVAFKKMTMIINDSSNIKSRTLPKRVELE
jgi:hypothetical protein